MKYLVESISKNIIDNSPISSGEALIRVDGFESIEIYEAVASKVSKRLEEKGLSVIIKLSHNKWNELKATTTNTSCVQKMEQMGWVADNPLTFYRNLHESNVLLLMGTEAEEDKGGLLNIFTITPDTIVKDLNKEYARVFDDTFEFGETEKSVVNKLYGDLFGYVPVDVCKLSNMADDWADKVSTIKDFIELFFCNLPLWGLPLKKVNLPSSNEVLKKKNAVKLEHDFISRQMFKRLSKTQYKKYQQQIEKYAALKKEFDSSWEGWSDQAIKSYEEFSRIVKEFIRGEDIQINKDLLIHTDFSVVEAVLEIKLDKHDKPKVVIPVVTGDPLEAFTSALLFSLSPARGYEKKTTEVSFEFIQADIVSMYSDTEGDEEKQQLLDTWKVICRHTNGVIEYLNQRMWEIDGNEVELTCAPEQVFLPSNAKHYIDEGIVKAASSNKTLNIISFKIICKDENGEVIDELAQEYQWRFANTSSWLHNFADICGIKAIDDGSTNYIPVAILKKITALLFAKSEEEFFDLYDESDVSFDFNLSDYIDSKCNGDAKIISAKFDVLGRKFVDFVKCISDYGFYGCLGKANSEIVSLRQEYQNLGEYLIKNSLPENLRWILDAYIHAFNIEGDIDIVSGNKDAKCCVVPAWHPAALEKLSDQKIFFLDGCKEWWNSHENTDRITGKDIAETVENLMQMGMIQSALDIFPSYGQTYFGAVNSFGAFSVYGRNDIENNSRLKDMIHKDAIYDDDFDTKENIRMNDNAKMIYGVIADYTKAFPNSYCNLSIVFVNPSELQPIIAAVYKFIDETRKKLGDKQININIKVLVKPENKGGRNYLAYWMDESFSQDSNVNIHTYLNEWVNKADLDKILNGNNDIAFVMDLLKVNNYGFAKESGDLRFDLSQCRFPIVFKPSPVSDTSSKTKRRIELSQPQFRTSYAHTQVARYRNNYETLPDGKYIAIREVSIDDEAQDIVYSLHEKAYWVVCVDSGMDGALLRNNENYKTDYSIIGFSTGKGAYGQYNLTVTARKSILNTIQKKLEARLYQLFHWDSDKIKKAASLCLSEASGLDGISLLSAINQKDRNINEFMAYVLTSLRERETQGKSALKIVVHLDSYKHWFGNEIEADDNENSKSRPDFLVLEANLSDADVLQLKATVVECKIASFSNAPGHKEKALKQVKHGISVLSNIFSPNSTSIKRRYWYAQMYRALAFSQVTFSDNTAQFAELSSKLRSILDGNFEIEWSGKVLGFWIDSNGEAEKVNDSDDSSIKVYDVPQQRIQQLLLQDSDGVEFVFINSTLLIDDDGRDRLIANHEKEMEQEVRETSRKAQVPDTKESDASESHGQGTVNVEEHEGEKENDVPKESQQEQDAEVVVPTEVPEDDNSNVPENVSGEKADTSVSLDEVRVLIGNNKSNEHVYWEFGHPQLANRHMLITGTSGQGKTYSIQTMLYELSKNNVSSVIFDYTEGFRLDQLEKEFVSKMGDKISQHIVKVQGVPINPFKQHEIDIAGMKMKEPASDVAARFANILIHVYGFGDQQFSAIFEATRLGIEKHGEAMNMQHFQEELEEQKAKNKSAQTVLSKMAPFFWSISFNEQEEFDWGELLYSNDAVTKIFQLTLIDREMQVIITELMLWDAWYYTKKVGSKDKPFVVVLDEAQNLSHKSNSPSAAILTEGRKFGWSAWFATQSLKVLADDEVVRLLQAAFKLYFKPTDDEVIKMSKQLDPSDGSTWLNALKSLKKGQCIVVGERLKEDGRFGQTKPTITSVTSFKERS